MGCLQSTLICGHETGPLKQSTWTVDGPFREGVVNPTLFSACVHRLFQNPK